MAMHHPDPRLSGAADRVRLSAPPPPCGSAAVRLRHRYTCHHQQHLPPHPWPTYRHIHCRWYADGASISLGVGGHPCIAATTTRSLPPPQSLQRRALAASSAAAIAPCHHHIHPAHHHSYSYHSASSRRRPPPRPLLSQTPLWQRKGACCPHTSKGLRSDQRSVGAVCEGRAVHRDAQVFGEGRGARATRRGNFLVERAVR